MSHTAKNGISGLLLTPWSLLVLLALLLLFVPDVLQMFGGGGSGSDSFVQRSGMRAETLADAAAVIFLLLAFVLLLKDLFKTRGQSSPVSQLFSSGSNPVQSSHRNRVQYDDHGESISMDAPKSWSLALLQAIEWKRFEALCVALFGEMGFDARGNSHVADGSVDIELYDLETPKAMVGIVQCKAWQRPVGGRHVREFCRLVVANRVSKAYFVTTATFTDEAERLARLGSVTLISGPRLLGMIDALSPLKRNALLQIATEGDFTTPSCPACGKKMAASHSPESGNNFWVCSGCKEQLYMRKPDARLLVDV